MNPYRKPKASLCRLVTHDSAQFCRKPKANLCRLVTHDSAQICRGIVAANAGGAVIREVVDAAHPHATLRDHARIFSAPNEKHSSCPSEL
jgi:hypothetical protein